MRVGGEGGLRVEGRFDAKVNALVPIDASGKFKLLIHDLDVYADIAFHAGEDGQPRVCLSVHLSESFLPKSCLRASFQLSAPFCRTKADVEVQLYDTGAFLDLILRGIRGIINTQVRTGLESKLCDVRLFFPAPGERRPLLEVVRQVIEQDANRLLKDFPLSTNMDEKLGKIGNLFGLQKGANMVLPGTYERFPISSFDPSLRPHGRPSDVTRLRPRHHRPPRRDLEGTGRGETLRL